jgi:hypothetical protein
LGDLNIVHVPAENIRMRVDVHIDHAGGGTYLGRGRWKRGLCVHVIKREQGQGDD